MKIQKIEHENIIIKQDVSEINIIKLIKKKLKSFLYQTLGN